MNPLLWLCAASLMTQELDEPPQVMEVHDVRDLVRPIHPEEAESLPSPDTALSTSDPATRAGDLLATLLRHEAGPGTEVMHSNGVLVTRGSEEVQHRARALLKGLREGHSQILLEITIVRGDTARLDPALRATGIELDPDMRTGHAAFHVDQESRARIERGLNDVSDTLITPSILSLALQPWTMEAIARLPYVERWEEVEITDGGWIKDPVILTLRDGLDIHGQAVATRGGDGATIAFALEFTEHHVRKPIARERTEHGVVQKPETAQDRFAFQALLQPKHDLLVVGPVRAAFDDKVPSRTLLWVRGSVVVSPDDEEPKKSSDRR